MKRSARITIHPDALQHNLKRAQQAAPNSQTLAVIKADAYGHGALATAGILYPMADGFAVSCLPEAVVLREAGIDKPITILQGHQSLDDLRLAAHYDLRLTVHDDNQLSLLDHFSQKNSYRFALNIKLDTGMHRLGFEAGRSAEIFKKLRLHSQVDTEQLMMMTHFSCADELQNNATQKQLERFTQACETINSPAPLPQSMANSAAILNWPQSHADWVRPGIMLYGSSPVGTVHRDDYELRAAMSLHAPVIAVRALKQGDAIGYGASWLCPNDMTVAVVACGYADGYPRHAKSGTPVLINGQQAQLVGRVSMDMIVVDIGHLNNNDSAMPAIKVGDQAELWGTHLSVDLVAESAETIGYELLCQAGSVCALAGT